MQSSIISSRVTGGFAALLVILVITFIASVHGASRLAALDAAVTHARNVLEQLTVTRGVLHEVESARRGYLLTRDNEFLELYLTATKEAVTHLERLRELTADDPAQRRRVDAIRPLAARQLMIVTESMASRAGASTAGSVPDDGTVITEQIRGIVAELADTERARLAEREQEADVRTVKVIRSFGAVALVALVLLGAAYYVLDRDAAVHAAVLNELRSYSRPTRSTTVAEAEVSPGRAEPEHGTPG